MTSIKYQLWVLQVNKLINLISRHHKLLKTSFSNVDISTKQMNPIYKMDSMYFT